MVRVPRKTGRLVVLAAASVLALIAVRSLFPGSWFFLILPGPWLLARPHVARTRVVASREGLRLGERLIPRGRFTTALLRHEDGATFVALRGKTNVDVEVASNVEADALLQALELDAGSAAVEFPLSAPVPVPLVAVAMFAAFGAIVYFAPRDSPIGLVALAGFFLAFTWGVRLVSRAVLRVGADGILVKRTLGRRRFLRHDEIRNVQADGDAVVVTPAHGQPLTFTVQGGRRGNESRRQDELRADEAAAIVRRISQARRAFDELGARAPDLAAALARGSRTTEEWMNELRRIGAGASGTFRTIGVARDQLFAVVESTTAAARDRLAAIVALRATLTEDEKPRIRVAAERCALPDLREKMLRIAETEDEGDLEEELQEIASTE